MVDQSVCQPADVDCRYVVVSVQLTEKKVKAIVDSSFLAFLHHVHDEL